MLHRTEDGSFVTIDNQLLAQSYEEGLFITLEDIVERDEATGEMSKAARIFSITLPI